MTRILAIIGVAAFLLGLVWTALGLGLASVPLLSVTLSRNSVVATGVALMLLGLVLARRALARLRATKGR